MASAIPGRSCRKTRVDDHRNCVRLPHIADIRNNRTARNAAEVSTFPAAFSLPAHKRSKPLPKSHHKHPQISLVVSAF